MLLCAKGVLIYTMEQRGWESSEPDLSLNPAQTYCGFLEQVAISTLLSTSLSQQMNACVNITKLVSFSFQPSLNNPT